MLVSRTTGAVLLLAAATPLVVMWRGRRKERALLAALKRANKALYLMVTDKTGTRFVKRSLRSVLKARGLAIDGPMHDLAARLIQAAGTQPKRKLRHALVRGAIDGFWLTSKLEAMIKAYAQQPLDYGPNSRYGANWKISCYLVVLEKWKPRITPHLPLVAVYGDVMDRCVAKYEEWHASFAEAKKATVMNCFLTRYDAAKDDENQLKKHIDGANVQGSVILACPTDTPYEGGGLKVWDGEEYFYDDLRPGDCIFLKGPLWHQALPISKGIRYALVLFLALK